MKEGTRKKERKKIVGEGTKINVYYYVVSVKLYFNNPAFEMAAVRETYLLYFVCIIHTLFVMVHMYTAEAGTMIWGSGANGVFCYHTGEDNERYI